MPSDRNRETATVLSQTRHERLLQSGQASPRFLQGVFPFVGRGMFDPEPLHPELTYIVPEDKTAEVLYVRGGNHADDLVYLTLLVNGKPVRYFPVGPKSDFHVPLAIVEAYPAGARIEVGYAAAHGLNGALIVDVGILEVAG